MSCIKNPCVSKGFTICFPQGSVVSAVRRVTDFLQFSRDTFIISIQQDNIHLFTEISEDQVPLGKTEEPNLERLNSSHGCNILVKDGKLYILPEELDNEIHEIKTEVLKKQNGQFFKFEDDLDYLKDADNKIREETFKASSRYNDIALKKKLTVKICLPHSNQSDDQCNLAWPSIKQKRKHHSEHLSNQNSKHPISHSHVHVERETTQSDRAGKAKGYFKGAAGRKHKVVEDDENLPKSVAKERNSRKIQRLSTKRRLSAFPQRQRSNSVPHRKQQIEQIDKKKYSELIIKGLLSNQDSKCLISHSHEERERRNSESAKESKGYLKGATGRKRKVVEDDEKLEQSTRKERNARKMRRSISTKRLVSLFFDRQRSSSLPNRKTQDFDPEMLLKLYREYEDKNKVENYFGKENDVLSVKSDKREQKHGNVDDGHVNYGRDLSKQLRKRMHLPFSQRPVPPQVYHVYPGKRKKQGPRVPPSSQRSDTDRVPVQVSDAANEPSPRLPPRDQVVTSAVSVYRQNQFLQFPPPTCSVMSFANEQALTMRLHGLSNRSRHGRAPPPAKHPQYAELSARLASYTHWPRETRQQPSSMANYGFFHTGRVDLVRCFQCGIGLKDWSEPDEPLFEHIKHAPDCPHLLRLLGPELLAAYKVNLVPGSAQPTAARPPPVEGPGSHEVQGATGGATPNSAVRSPEYTDLSARLRSFDSGWSRNMSQSPLEVAEAGFYYTGEGDVCRCFTCDGGLTRWDPQDDPWVEHAKWFPQCAFVRQTRGDEYVNLIQQAIADSDDDDPSNDATTTLSCMTVSPPEPMSTPAAQTAIEMGYSRTAVSLAVHELIAKDKYEFSAQDIVDILLAKQERGEALPSDPPPSTTPLQSTSTSAPTDDKETLEKDNTRLSNILKCMMCNERFTNILFLPCTHHRMCEECADDVTMCPVCGRSIDKKVKTYMS